MTESAIDELNQAIGDAVSKGHSIFIIGIPEERLSAETKELLTKLDQIPASNKIFARNAFHDLLNSTFVAEFAEKLCTGNVNIPSNSSDFFNYYGALQIGYHGLKIYYKAYYSEQLLRQDTVVVERRLLDRGWFPSIPLK